MTECTCCNKRQSLKWGPELEESIIANTIRKLDLDEASSKLMSNTVLKYHFIYTHQDDFTLVMMIPSGTHDTSKPEFFIPVGMARRCPDDNNNPIRGKAIALSRAIRTFAKKVMGFQT